MMLSLYDLGYIKEASKDYKLLYFIIDGQEFIFRTMGFMEYENTINICENSDEADEVVCQVTLIYPEEYNFTKCPAGYPSLFAPQIVQLSGFRDAKVVTESFKAHQIMMKSTKYSTMALVKAAMPEISWDEMEDWSWDKLLRYGAAAQKILSLLGHDIDMESAEPNDKDKENASELSILDYYNIGIDPVASAVVYRPAFVDFPLIGGQHWKNGEVINEIRKQMECSTR